MHRSCGPVSTGVLGRARHGVRHAQLRPSRRCAQGMRTVMQQQGQRPSSPQQQQQHAPGHTQPPGGQRPDKRMHSFFYFNPEDPEQVVEVTAAGATNKEALVPVRSRDAGKLANQEDGALSPKAVKIQQELLSQLEHTRGKLQELQQSEAASREWRMRAQQASAELTMLQRALLEKDNELATAYKRLESAAEERMALRKAVLKLDEETKSLREITDEVRLLGASKDASAAAAAASEALAALSSRVSKEGAAAVAAGAKAASNGKGGRD